MPSQILTIAAVAFAVFAIADAARSATVYLATELAASAADSYSPARFAEPRLNGCRSVGAVGAGCGYRFAHASIAR
jgi:hypothetical protein